MIGAATAARAQAVDPVDGVVTDTFRPPAHIGAPGNRGWEYATTPGGPVRAVHAGVIAFAGNIGGRLYVSIDHGAGLRTTYSFVASIDVGRGEAVAAGRRIGTTGAVFHFGVRRDGRYIDPALLLGGGSGGRVWLVPRGDPEGSTRAIAGPTALRTEHRDAVPLWRVWQYTLRLARPWVN